MKEFFNGWRQKVGCVTLVLACVLLIGWIRSYFVLDALLLRGGKTLTNLSSAAGNIRVVMGRSHLPQHPTSELLWGKSLKTEVGFERPAFLPPFDWTFQIYGINWSSSRSLTILTVAYSWLVVPPTLLSAYLLLSRPRTAKKPEPPPTTGA